MNSRAFAFSSLCLIALSAVAYGADVTPDAPAGWRGNWTGQFPDCAPPTSWERRCTSPVSEIRYSLHKPANESDAGAIRPASQSIVHWMVLGPFAPKNAPQALDEETIPNESLGSPDDESRLSGGRTWSAWEMRSMEELFLDGKSTDDVTESVDFEKVFPKDVLASVAGAAAVAYAHTYLYSPRAGTVALLLNHANGLKIWVNGKVVLNENQPVLSGCVNHYGFAKFEWHWGATETVNLKLEKGWNHVLLKCVRGDKGWFINSRLTAPADAKYECKNIAWETHLPSRGYSCPIVVGERIFMTMEIDDLVCIDKRDGKVLWRRSNNFYDAATAEERAANPLWETLEPINAKLQSTASYPESLALHRQMQDVLLQIDKKQFDWGDPRFGPVQGNAVPTACSDGKQVYVYFSSGVAACYDLDGNRKWIRNNRDLGNVGGYNTQSPAIVDGVFILYRHRVRGLDANTGEIRWTSAPTGEDERAQCVVPITVDGEKCVMAHHNHYFRARDGQFLGGGSSVHHATAVVAENNRVINSHDSCFEQWRLLAIEGGAIKTQGLPSCGSPFTGTYNVASPLVENGMVYVLNLNGNLTAWNYSDAGAQVKYAIKRLEDLHPLVQPWNWNVGLCASPILGGKYVYIMDNQGTAIALEPGDAYRPVAVNRIENYLPRGWITNTQENTYSSPVCDGNSLLLRGDETLYCIRGISAVLTADVVKDEAPLQLNLDGGSSFSGNGTIDAYAWDFGDHTTAKEKGTTHTYQTPGDYRVRLTVKDEKGAEAIAEKTITVLKPDTAAPEIVSVAAGYGKKIVITFSKPMARSSAETVAHYSIQPELKVLSAKLRENGRIVELTTEPLNDKTAYTLSLKGVVDCAKKPNSIADGTTAGFHTSALVAHWKLNEGSGIVMADSSGFGHDATCATPVWGDGGETHPGRVLAFNSADSGLADAGTFFPDLSTPFSISLWVNPAAQQDELADILGNHGGQFSGFVVQQDGKITNSYSIGYGDGKQWLGAGPVQLAANTWQHLAAVCDGEHAILYLNGVEKARADAKTPLVPNSRLNFRLGQGFANARCFRGALSDVRLFTSALSAAEIQDLSRPAPEKNK